MGKMGKPKRLRFYHFMTGMCLVVFVLGSLLADPNSPKIRDVKLEIGEKSVGLTVKADKPVQVRPLSIGGPAPKLVFDISPSVLWGKKETKPVGRFGIQDIRVAQFSSDPDVTRVVVDLDQPLPYKMTLSPDGEKLLLAFEANPSPAASKDAAPEKPPQAAEVWRHAKVTRKWAVPVGVSADLPAGLKPVLAPPSLQAKLSRLYLYRASLKKKKRLARAPARKAEETASFSWKDADLTDVVRSLADRLGLNVIVDTSVKGTVTLDLRNVPASQALGMILAINGYASRQIGNILVVGPPDKLEKLPSTPIAVGPQALQVIPLEYSKPADLRDTILSEYPGVKVNIDARTNSLLVQGPVPALRKVKELVSELDKPVIVPAAVAPQRVVIALNYAKVKDVMTQIKPLLPSDAVLIEDDRMNSIIVSGSGDTIDAVKSFINDVDVPEPQVMLEMEVLDIDVTADRNLGVGWPGSVSTNFAETAQGEAGAAAASLPNPGGSTISANSIQLTNLGFHTFVRDNVGFKTTINFLVSRSKAKLLGAPRIATINGKQAVIHLGQHVPIIYFDPRAGLYQAQYIDVGVILKVTPTISQDGNITIDLNPSVSTITGFQQNFPQIASRDAQTTLRIKNGETVVLGGLLSETNTDAVTKIPLLGDIPIIGQFFRDRVTHHEKDDLVISITPTLLANR